MKLLFVLVAVLGIGFFVWMSRPQPRPNYARNAPAPAAPSATRAPVPKAQPVEPEPSQLYKFTESRDPMNDSVRYVFGWNSEKSRKRFSILHEMLLVRVTPSELVRPRNILRYEVECIIGMELSFVSDDIKFVTIRFDDNPAQQWRCSASTSSTGVFIKDASRFFVELAKSKRVRVRLETLGRQRDIEFQIGPFSLQTAVDEMVRKILQSRPPNVTIKSE